MKLVRFAGLLISAAAFVGPALSVAAAPLNYDAWMNRQVPAVDPQARDAFVDNLLRQMTLDEKIGQLRLISVGPDNLRPDVLKDIAAGRIGAIFNTVVARDIRPMQQAAVDKSRLKIPLFFAYDVLHGHRTVFPIGLGLAASWDMNAVATSARIAAQEAAADGLDMSFSPMVDITRDPRWGRVSEGYGEDTWLTSRIGEVVVRAYQGRDLSAPDSIMAGVKHFALYGAGEGGRDYNTVDMSPQRMAQDYLPPYKAAVDAGAGGMMISLNSINGIPATSNTWLLQDVLRKQWGFKGLTISDHGAIHELMRHGVARDGREAAKLAIQAGIDLSMNDRLYAEHLGPLLRDGEIAQDDIDRAVRDVLAAKYDLGLFADPYRRLGPASEDPPDVNAESRLHRDAARDIARRSLVLLKNDNQTLPLAKQGTIAVVGPLADSQRDVMGSWSAAGVAKQSVSVLAGMRSAVGDRVRFVTAHGANVTDDPAIQRYLNEYLPDVVVDPRPAQAMIDEAVQAALAADVVVAVVGEAQGMAHEASSRTDIDIPPSQKRLLEALKATGKPLVIVLMNGRPLSLTWENANADAMLETWFAGTEGGNAIADVLFGDYNPSGKLTMTFPKNVGQVPLYYQHLNTGRPFNPAEPNKYTSRYFDIENGPLFPFGYGLSYTRFSLSDVRLSSKAITARDALTASITVRNTGKRAGETVVQLYLQDLAGSISRPVKELKGFQKVMLQPGEQRTLQFPIAYDDLSFINNDLKRVVEPGDFKVYLGLDSQDVKEARFTLQ
ncbi:MAG: beta-glucosidase BglX [Achromobacter sp.]